MARYETYLWMELIGLDNQAPDMGVKAYLDSLGFKPDGISIFMWGPDFVHCHYGLQEDEYFPPDVGAYMDTWFDKPKYQGPPWSKWMLKRAIEEFHRHGVKVLFSVFPCSLGNRWHREWIYEHPEVANVTVRNMQPATPVIHILKRFADGAITRIFCWTRSVKSSGITALTAGISATVTITAGSSSATGIIPTT